LKLDHPKVTMFLNNMAEIYESQGKYDEAELLYRRALIIDEKALGPCHPSIAGSLDNLAMLHHCQSKYEEAEKLYRRALSI
jgi:tetratricopeptide (TPR) repeat protein